MSSEENGQARVARQVTPFLILVFCLSGASALAYQVLWTRQLTLVLGGTAIAISTVLATFMGGLGFGAYLGGKFADRTKNPLLIYALAEAIIAIFALATPVLLSASGTLFLGLYRIFQGTPVLLTVSRILATAILLFLPATLMGATLPLVARFFIRRIDHLGRGLGLLYGINTLGGVIGCSFVGYYGILVLGIRASTLVAVGANITAVLGAILISVFSRGIGLVSKDTATKISRGPIKAGYQETAGDARFRRVVMIGFAISGLTAIGYEVLWTRALSFAIGSSVFAFTTVLAVFLTGLFIGSFLAGILADRSQHPMRTLGFIQALIAVVTLIAFSQAHWLPDLTHKLVRLFGATSLSSNIATKVIPAAAALLIPTIIIGLTFPFILKVATDRLEKLGTRLGECYAVNTIGSVVGSLLAGFILLPFLGVTRGFIILALCNTIMAHIFFQHAKGSRYTKPALVVARVAIVVLVAAAVLVQPKPLLLNTRAMKSGHREIVYHEEGRAATVSVVKNMDAAGREWGRFLFINVLFAADVDVTHVNRQYYSGLSLIPTVLHPNPKHVFVAGLASGASTGAAALDERTERVTCVELLPEVIRGGKYFAEYNYHAMDNPKIDIIRDDARAYLETTDETYDIIVTDCFISAITGTAALYSLEYFKLCARRLKPGGFMSVGAGHLTGTDRSIARTFIEAFPEVAVFAMDTGNPDHNPTFLIGANEPIRFSRESIVKAFQQDALRIELTRFAIPAADTLIASYLCTGKDLLPYILDTESCTDDKPTIDFLAVTWIEGFTPEFVRVGTSDIWALKPQLADLREFPYLNP